MSAGRLAIIGAGHLASALVSGLAGGNRKMAASDILVCSPGGRSSDRLAQQFGVGSTADNRQAAAFADTWLLAVRPAQMQQVLDELRPLIEKHLVISLAAGWRCERLAQSLPKNAVVCRAMPNLGIGRNLGFTGCCHLGSDPRWDAESEPKQRVQDLFSRLGEVAWIAEEQMDALTAVAGSGPGFVFEFARSLALAGRTAGLDDEQAKAMVVSVVRTCAGLLQDNPNAGTWRDKVASKGGVTEAGLKHLEQGGLPKLVEQAIQEAVRRAGALAEEN